jgi:hypothetical protein
MNELITELAEQAGFENGHQDRYGNSLSYELEKFAELIVREFISMSDELKAQYRSDSKNAMIFDEKQIYAEGAISCDTLESKMKKHFGVDEPEDSTCPDCGADGGTQCGSINCGY